MTHKTTHHFFVADATVRTLKKNSVDIVVCSPPYIDARSYGTIKASRKCDAWIEWMLQVLENNLLQVSKGPVIINCASGERKGIYQPAPEGLIYAAWKRGIICRRPAYWNRHGIPGKTDWLRNDIEYCFCFSHKNKKKFPYADLTPIQVKTRSHVGKFTNRKKDGTRYNKEFGSYVPKEFSNPGNLIKIDAAGSLGHPMAHDTDAPYPIKLPMFFINAWCPVGGTVYDSFSGSGTTAAAAKQLGRNSINSDLRPDQIPLGIQRVETPWLSGKRTKEKKGFFATK